eukprot:CAMPEP_0171294442 /NCGR_PEP_ID=MMETSP0816-20121228/2929_1 /TAXON_ID=420281 /ORGANISM="Proboscia inermis, Strain CCAP1064/1" /LENGTH=305 /DNA_ID=CAMNT_0011766277 /DNA_START=24 /DNA_END=941 /DNA_ORIENTATION=+
MVDITVIEDEENEETEEEELPSLTRELDADAIEKLAKSAERPSVRAHLDSLVSKLRRESAALKRVEASKQKSTEEKADSKSAAVSEDETVKAASNPEPAVKALSPPTSRPAPPVVPSTAKYCPINKFAFDAGSYNSAFLTLYINLPGVGKLKKTDKITCDFTATSFDLIVRDLDGKSYRLFNNNLEKNINPEVCKFVVKAEKVLVKLGKVKGEYGSYDSWQGLSGKKDKNKKETKAAKKDDPSASIMGMMKDMYDSGDDKMKKMIGETMMKQRNGELGKDMPGAGGMGGMGGGMGGMGMDGFGDM